MAYVEDKRLRDMENAYQVSGNAWLVGTLPDDSDYSYTFTTYTNTRLLMYARKFWIGLL